MSCHLHLVENDNAPGVIVQLTEDSSGSPLDLTPGGTTAAMKFREVGSSTVYATLAGTIINGFQNEYGELDVTGPYAVAGGGGRILFPWGTTLHNISGQYEGSVTVTFASGVVLTNYEVIHFTIRPAF